MTSRRDWWHGRREELLDLAGEKTPLCLYNEETLNETLFDLLSIEVVDRLFYPMYINSHPKVYEKVYEMDVGFTCLSMDEMARVFKVFPRMKPQRLLFMPDSDISEEYEYALQLGIHVVVRNLFSLRACQDVFQNGGIFIGLEMTYDQGGLVQGIHFSEMEALSGLLRTRGTTVSGLYLNSKRGFRSSFDLNGTASVFKGVSAHLPEVSTLILGNGMCICLEPNRGVLDIPEMGNRLEAIKEISPQYKLWLDPGPYIISYAGVILTRVIDSFAREHHRYVRINLDMQSYAQYALDQTQLAMVNLSKLENEVSSFPHMIVQEIENDSRLCHIKGFAPADEGDILLIPNVGAIGLEAGLKSHHDDSDNGYYLKARKMCPVKI
ncbi:MAG: hypothetical protein PVH99_13660 [Desulfobacteraceae bacterium]|jgi:diaminopimelate decarboxylase/aspartate kinase